jgi:cytochrome b561
VSDTGARRYSAVAIGFHWLIAAAIVGQIGLGWYMSELPNGLRKFELFQLHKSVGLTILLLSLARLAWRLSHRPPPYAADVPGWQRTAATTVHVGFYVLMIVVPLTGWAAVSASPYNIPTLLWEVIPWPHLPGLADLPAAQKEGVADALGTTHEWLVRLTVLLLLLHVAAAMKHHLLDRDETLWRMLPLVRRRRLPLEA